MALDLKSVGVMLGSLGAVVGLSFLQRKSRSLAESDDYVPVTVYSYMQWTGPGRSHNVRTFKKPGPYVQTANVFKTECEVPRWFADLTRDVDASNEGYLLREGERHRFIPPRSW